MNLSFLQISKILQSSPAHSMSRLLPALVVTAIVSTLAACGGSADSGADTSSATLPENTQKAMKPQAVRSAKRGIAYGHHSVADMRALAPGVGWWYNWSPASETSVAANYRALGMSFVSMVWGGAPNAQQLETQVPSDSKFLLGFNEPNFKSQSNKTPSKAAALWPVLEQVAQHDNLQLGSPAVNYCGDCVSENGVTYQDPVVYLDAFFADCKNCKVDFIAVHWYACDVSALQWYINKFKKYNKPIWLTEFSCGDKPANQITLALQENYMMAAVNYLENEPAVARYAWFSGRDSEVPNSSLLGNDGQLTALGQLYVSLPAATGKILTPVSASASSQENAGLSAAKAIDGNAQTRWSSAFSDNQEITLDFGTSVSFDHLDIHWEAAYAKQFNIETSNDMVHWTTVSNIANGSGGVQSVPIIGASGRYVRIQGIKRATPYGYSIYDIVVWGT